MQGKMNKKHLLRKAAPKMNKKAQVPEGMLWIARMLLIILPLILAIAIFVKIFLLSVDVSRVEASILAERSLECFSDETGVIKLDKFTKDQAEKCFAFGAEGGLQMKLQFSSTSQTAETPKFSLLEPLCGLKGASVPYCYSFRKNIIVDDGTIVQSGAADIKILLLPRHN